MKKGFILGSAAAIVAFIAGHTVGYFRGVRDDYEHDHDDPIHCGDCCSCDDCDCGCGCDDLDDEDEESAE